MSARSTSGSRFAKTCWISARFLIGQRLFGLDRRCCIHEFFKDRHRSSGDRRSRAGQRPEQPIPLRCRIVGLIETIDVRQNSSVFFLAVGILCDPVCEVCFFGSALVDDLGTLHCLDAAAECLDRVVKLEHLSLELDAF